MQFTKEPLAKYDDLEDSVAELPELDLEVLRQLYAEAGTVAFQGLRHRLHVHQERLSRSLQRLESEGLVRRSEKGYEITIKGSWLALQGSELQQPAPTQIMSSFLPGEVNPRSIAATLEGRRFGHLRWLGIREGTDITELRWFTDKSGVEVTLGIGRGQLTISTNARDYYGMVEAFIAAQQLFSMVSGPWCHDWDQGKLPVST